MGDQFTSPARHAYAFERGRPARRLALEALADRRSRRTPGAGGAGGADRRRLSGGGGNAASSRYDPPSKSDQPART